MNEIFFLPFGPAGAQDQDRFLFEMIQKCAQQFQGKRIEPVKIIEKNDRRAFNAFEELFADLMMKLNLFGCVSIFAISQDLFPGRVRLALLCDFSTRRKDAPSEFFCLAKYLGRQKRLS